MDMISVDMIKMFLLIYTVTLPFKGVALWMSARRGHMGWFIAMLVLNTLAILEIIYIIWVGRRYTIELEKGPSRADKGDDLMNTEK